MIWDDTASLYKHASQFMEERIPADVHDVQK